VHYCMSMQLYARYLMSDDAQSSLSQLEPEESDEKSLLLYPSLYSLINHFTVLPVGAHLNQSCSNDYHTNTLLLSTHCALEMPGSDYWNF